MQGKCLFPSIFVMAALLVACASKVESPVTMSQPHAVPMTGTAQPEIISSSPPANCPITTLQEPAFVPPAPYDQLGFENEFWYGTNSLWTAVRQNGTWEALPHNPAGYTQKVFWWREGYSISEEPEPGLSVTAERLDEVAPIVTASKATNASAGDIGSAMLVGIDLPTLGCWQITGNYKEEKLSFVVWVAP